MVVCAGFSFLPKFNQYGIGGIVPAKIRNQPNKWPMCLLIFFTFFVALTDTQDAGRKRPPVACVHNWPGGVRRVEISCLYINKLTDIDLKVLDEMISTSLE